MCDIDVYICDCLGILNVFVTYAKILQRPKYLDAAEETLIQGNAHQQTPMLVGVLCKC